MKKFYLEGIEDVTYEGTDAGTWNGWAVPILPEAEYQRLKNDIDGELTRESGEPYEGTKVDQGWLCDGLCFVKAEEETLPDYSDELLAKQGYVRRKSAICEKCGVAWKGGWDFIFFNKEDAGYEALCLPCAESETDPELA